MRRSTTRREEGGVTNEGDPPRVDQVPIVCLGEEYEKVPLQEPQVRPESQVSPTPPNHFF